MPIVLAAFTSHSISSEFWVDPKGDDLAKGTREAPFLSLTRARDAARTVPRGEIRRIVVRGGDYYNQTLVLDSQDSGLVVESAPGEQAVLYGGGPLGAWQKDGEHFYAAPLPPHPQSGNSNSAASWEIRAIQVNGQWRPRARFPAKGELSHLSTFDVRWLSTTGGGWERKPTQAELTMLHYREGDLPNGLEIRNVEVTVFHKWDESCVGVVGQDTDSRTLKLSPPTGHPPGAFGVSRYVLWNIREGMQQPGQWYHDRTRNRVVYWPLPGEDMKRVTVIVPTTPTIIRIHGDPAGKVKDVTLKSLTLAVTTVPLISGGFAARHFDGAVSLADTEGCTLSGVTIRGVAGQAIKSHGANRRIRITDCHVVQCGAGGIYVDGTGTVISNNLVEAVGLSYPSAAGILGGGSNVLVSHNEIHDCPYTGICSGASESIFAHNLIYDCMKVLGDGAAIYLSAARDSVILGNVARDISDVTPGYGASAYYLDERCTHCLVESNISLRVRHPVHNHMATNNVIRKNVFVAEGDIRLTFPRSARYSFEGNIVRARGRIRFENVGAVTNWGANLMFSELGQIEQVQQDRYRPISTNSMAPPNSLTEDPQFENLAAGDLRLRIGPVSRRDYPFLDMRQAGRVKEIR